MQQLSENVIVLQAGDQFPPEGFDPNEFIKIALIGSTDLNPNTNDSWFEKFEESLVNVQREVLMYKNMKFMILDCKSLGPNGDMTYDNQAFLNKFQSDWSFMSQADAIFCNFLKRSTAQYPIYLFSSQLTSGKMLVRCPQEYFSYGYVRTACELNSVPLLPGNAMTVTGVLGNMFSFIPNLQKMQRYSI